MRNLLIADFDMYDQLESMQAYITQFFPVSPPLMDYIFSILTGIKSYLRETLFCNDSQGALAALHYL
jgi:hypothetical protein